MTASGKSLFYFGIYAVGAGLLFITIPDKLISLTRLPLIPAGWASVIGMLALVIGTYDIFCGHSNIKSFIKISVYTRLGFASGTLLLFVFQQMPAAVILFGSVDALGAIWTMLALKWETSAHNDLLKRALN